MITSVRISDKVAKSISKLPSHIRLKLLHWVESIEFLGIHAVRKIPGYHDEPLKGHWFGFRSIRLNRSYRAIYRINDQEVIEFVEIFEVNKHDY